MGAVDDNPLLMPFDRDQWGKTADAANRILDVLETVDDDNLAANALAYAFADLLVDGLDSTEEAMFVINTIMPSILEHLRSSRVMN